MVPAKCPISCQRGSACFFSLISADSRLINHTGYEDKEHRKAPQEIQGVQEYIGRVQMCWSRACGKALAAAEDRAESLAQSKGTDWPHGPTCSPSTSPCLLFAI